MLGGQLHRCGDKAAHHVQILVQQGIHGVQTVAVLFTPQTICQIGQILRAPLQQSPGGLQCLLKLRQIGLSGIRQLVDTVQSLVHGIQQCRHLRVRISHGGSQILQILLHVLLIILLNGCRIVRQLGQNAVQLLLGCSRIRRQGANRSHGVAQPCLQGLHQGDCGPQIRNHISQPHIQALLRQGSIGRVQLIRRGAVAGDHRIQLGADLAQGSLQLSHIIGSSRSLNALPDRLGHFLIQGRTGFQRVVQSAGRAVQRIF